MSLLLLDIRCPDCGAILQYDEAGEAYCAECGEDWAA